MMLHRCIIICRVERARRYGRALALMAACHFLMPVASAQDTPQIQAGTSSAGQVGQRQTGEQPLVNDKPLARLNNRVVSRIDARLHTRIDRTSAPKADDRLRIPPR